MLLLSYIVNPHPALPFLLGFFTLLHSLFLLIQQMYLMNLICAVPLDELCSLSGPRAWVGYQEDFMYPHFFDPALLLVSSPTTGTSDVI